MTGYIYSVPLVQILHSDWSPRAPYSLQAVLSSAFRLKKVKFFMKPGMWA